MDRIHAVIGRTVSSLLKSGQPLDSDTLVAALNQRESESVDGMKQTCAAAERLISDRLKKP